MLGLPHHMHVLGASGERNSASGSTRTVAAVSCLISASQAAEPQNPPYANPPIPFMNSRNCCLVTPRTEWASRRSRAALNSHAWISSSAVATVRVSPSSLTGALLPPRRAVITCPAATSRGPISSRSGTPLASHSKYLAPGFRLSRVSSSTRTPACASSSFTLPPTPNTCSFSSSDFQIGTITTCTGASLGGATRPLSSECVITNPPIIRVETPHDVLHTYSRPPAAVWYCTLNALAKFWPRLCDVPAWSALLSCISASRAYVRSAPANFSLSVFLPVITGIAIHSSWKRRYTPSIWRASASASASVACAVCPSCHRNSVVRRNSRVRNSQRTMLHHWFMSNGRSR